MTETQHHWHRDVRSRTRPRPAIVDGIERTMVVCCHCGARQYARLKRETRMSCGTTTGAGQPADVDAFIPIPHQPKARTKKSKAKKAP